MEEMNNIMENATVEIVEEVTDKLTFGENCMAYAFAGIFVTGVATVGYLGYKGVRKLAETIKDKRKCKEESVEEVVDVETSDIHEVKDDETEQD